MSAASSSYQSVEFCRPSKKSQNQNQYSQIDPTNRFGIGMAFQTEATPAPGQPLVPDAAVTQAIPPTTPAPGAIPGTGTGAAPGTAPAAAAPATVYTPPTYPTPLRCDLCGVSANRQDQLETHKRGARHLRMLRLNGLPVPDPGKNSMENPVIRMYISREKCSRRRERDHPRHSWTYRLFHL